MRRSPDSRRRSARPWHFATSTASRWRRLRSSWVAACARPRRCSCAPGLRSGAPTRRVRAMAPDPLDTLRLPIVPVSPRPAFAAELRRRVEDELGRSQFPEENAEEREEAMAVDLNLMPSVTPVLHYNDPE